MQGVAFAFNMPSRQALIGTLVGPQLMRNAVALNNAGMNFSRIAGPAIAGAILANEAMGVSGVFIAMTLMFGVVVISLFRLPAESDAHAHRADMKAPLADMIEGVSYVARSPALRALLLLALATTVIGMPFQTLLPLFAERVFDVGAVGLGSMTAAVGVGALLGAIFVATTRDSRPAQLQLALGSGYGLALVGFALSPWYPLALVILAMVGFFSAAYMALNTSLIMGNSEPRFYGRVMSIYQLTFGAMPLGSVPASWLADTIGGRETIVITGSLLAVIVLGVALLYRPYRAIS
jgi:MFS family permease